MYKWYHQKDTIKRLCFYDVTKKKKIRKYRKSIQVNESKERWLKMYLCKNQKEQMWKWKK